MGKTVINDDGRFEWDEEKKKKSTVKKHGHGFEEITDVFDDPYFLVRYDRTHSVNEERWNGIGCINGILVIVTTFTERVRTRIISAQRADNDMEEIYYDYIRQING